MDLRVLRFCRTIARTGSFTRAAEELGVAQPALSVAVGKLENELGVQLFARQPRGALPTAEGRQLLARAERIFAEVDSARRELADAAALRSGRLTIGFPPMYGLHCVPELIMAFLKRHPGLDVSAIEGSATATAEQLQSGAIDLGILEARRVDPAWRSVPLGSDEMVLAVARSHALARRRKLAPAGLEGLRMGVLTEAFLQRQCLDRFCEAHGVRYRQVMECNSVPLTVLAAQQGHGAATLLRALVERTPKLAALSFEPEVRFDFRLCWRPDRYLPKAAEALVTFATGVGGPRAV